MATTKSKAKPQKAIAGKKTAIKSKARAVAKSTAKAKPAPAKAKKAPAKKSAVAAKAPAKPAASKAAAKRPAKKAPVAKAPAKQAPAKKVPPKAKPVVAAKSAPPKTARPKAAPPKATAPKTTAPKAAAVKSTPAKSVPVKPVSAKAPVAPAPAAKAASAPAPKPAAAPPAPSKDAGPRPSRGSGKLLPRTFLFGLSEAIKAAVAPMVQQVKGREVVDSAVSGDATFEIDKVAEKALLNYLKAERAPVAYYSEDSGYSTFSNDTPQHLLIVDPIDGTRAAKNGFEACVVAIAATSVIERPTMADVESACVMEIMGERTFYAERGKGARIYTPDGKTKKPKLSENVNLETIAWSMTVPARPAALIFPTAAPLIDLTSLKGGFFACNSTSYSLTRLLTNQLDACVDFASRYMKEIPEMVQDQFINAGRGTVLGIAPYDMAASLLIAQEAGCIVTDAFGEHFDDVLLLDSSENNHQSIIAASNAALHEKLLSIFDTRIKQYVAAMHRARA
jgi:myo-inositol-1(or 4)-monophosphatase